MSLRKVLTSAEQFLSVKSIYQWRVGASSKESHSFGCSVEEWKEQLIVLQVWGIEKVLELDHTLILDTIRFCACESMIAYCQLLESRVRFSRICTRKENACSRESENKSIHNQITDTQYYFHGSGSQSSQLYSSGLFWLASLSTVIYLEIETKGTLLVQGKKKSFYSNIFVTSLWR